MAGGISPVVTREFGRSRLMEPFHPAAWELGRSSDCLCRWKSASSSKPLTKGYVKSVLEAVPRDQDELCETTLTWKRNCFLLKYHEVSC